MSGETRFAPAGGPSRMTFTQARRSLARRDELLRARSETLADVKHILEAIGRRHPEHAGPIGAVANEEETASLVRAEARLRELNGAIAEHEAYWATGGLR